MKRWIMVTTAVVAGGVLWYLFRPERLFVNKTVNEPFVATATSPTPASATPTSATPTSATPTSATPTSATPTSATPTSATAIASGAFHGVHHTTHGQATVYRGADGHRTLRFTDFLTSNGPDVLIYLIAAPDAADNATVTHAAFIDLGPMKGNQGDQNYDVPDSVDLATYRAVTVWCRRFRVNFATAPLNTAGDGR